jgi:hypothetical protein
MTYEADQAYAESALAAQRHSQVGKSPIANQRAARCRRLASVAAMLAVPAMVNAGTGAPDGQLWTELDVDAPLGGDTSITAVGQLRLSESLSNPIFTALGGDLNHKVSNEWTLGLGYRHELTPDRQGEDIKVTQVARVFAIWRRHFGRGTVIIRTRIENILNASGNPWRARVRAEYRWATPDWALVSYLYTNDEVFYEFADNEFFRNRFQAGLNLAFGTHTSLRVYYQRQDSKEQTPGAINALGLQMAISFD